MNKPQIAATVAVATTTTATIASTQQLQHQVQQYQHNKQQQQPAIWKMFVCGGVSSMVAEAATVPIDVSKIRLQLQDELVRSSTGQQPKYRGMIHTLRTVAAEEGVGGLYKGLSPALLRQAVYASLRIGVYDRIKLLICGEDYLKQKQGVPNATIPFYKTIIAGATAGAVGAFVASPTDLVKIRLQAEGRLPAGQTPRYRGVVHAFSTIVREEGFLRLWRGVAPTTQRAAVLNAAELATYDYSKQLLLRSGWLDVGHLGRDNVLVHFGASFMSGFCATLVANPIDVIKTRIMNQKVDAATGKPLMYSGVLDCAVKTVKAEGLMALYKGFIPNYMRIGPWCVIMFMTFEQLKKVLEV